MARFNATGIEGLSLSFEEFAKIPDAVIEDMLDAGGKVVADAHKASIRKLGLHKKGLLENSIEVHKKVRNGQRYVVIYPTGTHHTYNKRLVTKAYKRSKHGRTYTVGGGKAITTNNDVGFIHEYGAPSRNIPASHWMKKANEDSQDEMLEAQMKVYNEWLESLGL